MTQTWQSIKLSKVLTKSNEWIDIDLSQSYKQVTVKMWGKGVELRSEVLGTEISASKRLQVHPEQFILSRIDARHGAFGLIPNSLNLAVVTNDFPVFNLNRELLLPDFLNWLSKTADFVDICRLASEGTTNRVRLKEDKFLSTEIRLPPIAEQRRIVARIEELAAKIEEARGLRESAIGQVNQLETSASHNCFESLLKDGIKSVPFERVCRKITVGHVSSMRHAYRDIGISFLRSQNVRRNRFEPRGLCFIAPEFHEAFSGFEGGDFKKGEARLIIGDRAFAFQNHTEF
jgi:type I restriction enzyme S subunit